VRIAFFGATGEVGSVILQEMVRRGHDVTAVVRDRPERLPAGVLSLIGDVASQSSVARAATGKDAVASAVGGAGYGQPELVVAAAHSLIAGCRRSGVRRLMVVGGAGSLEAEPGVKLVDTPGFHDDWKPSAWAQSDALEVYKRDGIGLEWSYLSPSDLIEGGDRTGNYEIGLNALIRAENGESRISREDFAKAFVDELEQPRHIGMRFTVGYA
jgi:putative NADH-flavin reductase